MKPPKPAKPTLPGSSSEGSSPVYPGIVNPPAYPGALAPPSPKPAGVVDHPTPEMPKKPSKPPTLSPLNPASTPSLNSSAASTDQFDPFASPRKPKFEFDDLSFNGDDPFGDALSSSKSTPTPTPPESPSTRSSGTHHH